MLLMSFVNIKEAIWTHSSVWQRRW